MRKFSISVQKEAPIHCLQVTILHFTCFHEFFVKKCESSHHGKIVCNVNFVAKKIGCNVNFVAKEKIGSNVNIVAKE